MTLRDILDEAASGLPDLDVVTAPDDEVAWSRGGRPFAVLSIDQRAAEFGLDIVLASAAARTPDVVPSGRGPGWVLFRPAILDDHAADRAAAWFASAHRRLERA